MPDLTFRVEGAEPLCHAAAPTLIFKLHVARTDAHAQGVAAIHSILLRCQIRIEPTRRSYGEENHARLFELFGEPPRWSQTMRSMLWTHASVVVPAFDESTVVDLPVPCSYDFNLGATKYFYALDDGEVPLCLLLSGTVFYPADDGRLQVTQLPWDKEVNFRLPVRVWKEMMEHYYPGCVWLSLNKDTFDQLREYKLRQGLPTWEHALEKLLHAARDEVDA